MNYRKFYWTPDYNTYGFATKNQIKIDNAKYDANTIKKNKKEAKEYHHQFINNLKLRHDAAKDPSPARNSTIVTS